MQKSILITGASSGIGKALAECYAGTDIRLFLTGRNLERLLQVKYDCETKGAAVTIAAIDVADHDKMAEFIKNIPELDLVIANAGISSGTSQKNEDRETAQNIFDVNVGGVFNTVFPAAEKMKAQGYGQIALISSLASYRGLAGSPAYCASKAAVRIYGEALRDLLEDGGVKVNVVCPGFIVTPMTAVNKFKMPFLMKPEKAAAIIRSGLNKNRAIIAFPFPLAFLAWFLSGLPSALTAILTRHFPKK